MKGYRKIVPIIMVAFMAISIYTIISDAVSQQKELNEKIERANKCAEQELYDKSALLYDEIIESDNDLKHYLTVIDMYINAKDYLASEDWCERAKNEFPDSPEVYERLIRTYIRDDEIKDAFVVLDECDARKCTNKNIEAYRTKMEFKYEERRKTYEDVTAASSGHIGYLKKGLWGLATVTATNVIEPKYQEIGFLANELIPVKYKNSWYLMTAEGEFNYNITKSVKGKVDAVGLYSNSVIPICVDGKYKYYTLDFKSAFDEYDYAGAFSGGIAAVKKGNKWQLINAEGKTISNKKYEDVILDARGVCCQKERIFVKLDGQYMMIDTSGKQVGKQRFDNAKVFGSGDLAAVNIDGLWGFVNLSGELSIKPIYMDADSFSVGLAPVSLGDTWGYIDQNGEFIIEDDFDYCTAFNSKGTAFYRVEDDWRVIKLYKYNH